MLLKHAAAWQYKAFPKLNQALGLDVLIICRLSDRNQTRQSGASLLTKMWRYVLSRSSLAMSLLGLQCLGSCFWVWGVAAWIACRAVERWSEMLRDKISFCSPKNGPRDPEGGASQGQKGRVWSGSVDGMCIGAVVQDEACCIRWKEFGGWKSPQLDDIAQEGVVYKKVRM